MKNKERIKEIEKTKIFGFNEVKKNYDELNNTFISDEFYIIFHYTNEELYYLSDEEETNLKSVADEILDTEKSRIYCFK